jgi:hypothetical protein
MSIVHIMGVGLVSNSGRRRRGRRGRRGRGGLNTHD